MTQTPVSKRKKRLKKILIAAAISTGTLLGVILVAALLLQSRVKGILLKEINRQLTTKVEVKSVDASLLKSFPQVSLQFHDIRIPSLPGDTAGLISAELLSLQFSIIDIIRKNYSIRNIIVSNGKLSVLIPEQGKPNYLILREGDDDSEAVSFALRKVVVSNVDLEYRDRKNNIDINLYCKRAVFRGNFSADEYKLRTTGNIRINQLRVGSDRFFSGQEAVIDLVMDIDNRRDLYTIRKGNLDVEGLPFVVSGKVLNVTGRESIELDIEGKRMKIAHLLDLLPEDYSFVKKEYSPSGSISFGGSVSGSYAGKNIPVVEFAFGIDDGTVMHKSTGLKLTGIKFMADYSYSDAVNDLSIRNFSALLGDGSINGSLSMKDLKSPEIMTELLADLSVADLLAFFPIENLHDGEGRIRLNLKAETALSLSDDFCITHLLQSRSNGALEMSSISFRISDDERQYSGFNGRMVFDNNDVKVTDFKATINKTTLYLTGYFRNLFPYLLIADQQLEFKGEVKSADMDLRDILYSGTPAGGKPVTFPPGITGSVDMFVGKLRYDQFAPEDIRGTIRIRPGHIYAEQVRMKAFNGNINGALMVSQLADGSFDFDCQLNTSKADIRQLFRQFNNFGQDDLTDKNLRGLLTSRIRMQSRLTPQLIFSTPTLDAVGELIVEQGALLDYEPVKALAKYTRLDDLSDIRFRTLRNEIRISGEKVIIPEMMIRSDALDLTVAGTHTFDGVINYQVSMLLSELLSRKAKGANQRNTDFDLARQDQRGRLTLYLIIAGTVDDPLVRYDRRGQRQQIKEEVKTEKEEIKELFTKEFGTFNRQNERAAREAERQKEGVIIIEWDDD